MATAVLPAMQSLGLDREIMPPSPAGQGSSRHGRRSSVAGKKARGRGYSVLDERDVQISKALSWVLKRTSDTQEEGKLLAVDGWVNVEEVLQQPNVAELEVTLEELTEVVASTASKSRFAIKTEGSTTLVRANPVLAAPAAPTPSFTPLKLTSEDLPAQIIYETSYPNYPLILASGGIKRAGGQQFLSFTPFTPDSGSPPGDVAIYLSLPDVMAANPKITWAQTETGAIVTPGDAEGAIGKEFWLKAVARRADIGVLYENGEVRKEIPVGLRGKGAKGKGKLGGGKGKGREVREVKARGSEDEETGSE